MIPRRQERSLTITVVILTYFSFCGALAKDQASKRASVKDKEIIDSLRCEVGKPQMLEQWVWGKEKEQAEAKSEEGKKVFEIRDFHTKRPDLFDPKFKTLRPLKIIRRTDTVELFNFQSYNYTENFEYYIKTGKIEYTQIFRDVGSNAQFFVATGTCEVVRP